MGKSFVLRDASGGAIGYIQQVGERMRCGISLRDNCEAYDLYLLYEQGNTIHRQIEIGRQECEWHDTGALSGGCIVCSGKVIADTGKETREAIKKLITHQSKIAPQEPERSYSAMTAHEGRARFMKRRWPPNPCDLMAGYSERQNH